MNDEAQNTRKITKMDRILRRTKLIVENNKLTMKTTKLDTILKTELDVYLDKHLALERTQLKEQLKKSRAAAQESYRRLSYLEKREKLLKKKEEYMERIANGESKTFSEYNVQVMKSTYFGGSGCKMSNLNDTITKTLSKDPHAVLIKCDMYNNLYIEAEGIRSNPHGWLTFRTWH